jgi:hypothetical protein
MKKLNPRYFLDGKLAESAYDYERLEQLVEEDKLLKKERKSTANKSTAELLAELDMLKKEVGISWANSFSISTV